MSLNKVMIIGRLGKDPELRYTNGNKAVASFSIATDEGYTDSSGKRVDKTEWHRIVVWGKQAENCGKYLAKGREVYIEGKIQTREYDDRDGNKRRTTEIVANVVQFLGGRGDGGGNGTPTKSGSDLAEDHFVDGSDGFSDDEIPF